MPSENTSLIPTGLTAATIGLTASAAMAANPRSGAAASKREAVDRLVSQLQEGDAAARMTAARGAGPLGAAAVPALEPLLNHSSPGVVKASEEALERIAHHAARPGAKREAQAVTRELLRYITDGKSQRSQIMAIRTLQFVGEDSAVPTIAKLLDDSRLREEARLTLERIPGRAATRALETASRKAPADYRPLLQKSLNERRTTLADVGTKGKR